MHLIRSMGGSVRQEPNRETTHLIAATTQGPKYEYASTFLVPVMSADWVWACWRVRDAHHVHATDEQLVKSTPNCRFNLRCVCFYTFCHAVR